MEELDYIAAFNELRKESDVLETLHWVSTGHGMPELNSMLAVIWIRIRALEKAYVKPTDPNNSTPDGGEG